MAIRQKASHVRGSNSARTTSSARCTNRVSVPSGALSERDSSADGKGDRHLLPERPFGCFAQKVPVPFSRPFSEAAIVAFLRQVYEVAGVGKFAEIRTVGSKNWKAIAGS